MIKDYYKTLHLSRHSTDGEIKKAFRDLAIQLHPDKSKAPAAHDDFVALNEAFQILSDEEKRRKYNLLYDHYIGHSVAGVNNASREEFESIRREARKKGEKVADSDFLFFTSEILSEMVGQALFTGLIDGVGTVIKGTGDFIGDVISGLD